MLFFSVKAARDGRSHLVSVHLGNARRNTVAINEIDKDGFAPIHYAARFNRLEVLEQLLAAKAGMFKLNVYKCCVRIHPCRLTVTCLFVVFVCKYVYIFSECGCVYSCTLRNSYTT